MSPPRSRCSRAGRASGELDWAPSLTHVRRLLKTGWIITVQTRTHPPSQGRGRWEPGKPQALLGVDDSHNFIYKQQRAHRGAGTESQAEVVTLGWLRRPLENHFPLLQGFLCKIGTSGSTCDNCMPLMKTVVKQRKKWITSPSPDRQAGPPS